MGVRYSALPGHTQEQADALNEVQSKKWAELRGIMIVSFGVNSVKASDQDETMIKQMQRSAALRDPNLAATHIAGAQADAMKSAAANQGQGAVMAFAGLNMAQNAGGANAASLFEIGVSKVDRPETKVGWSCACGERSNTGKFCAECGAPKPEENQWVCACGANNTGKFCMECGKPKQSGAGRFKCAKCGWEPKAGEVLPKFCPECGDSFDDNDRIQ